jgi:APA family basic amino acid/polyamine antiporter
VVVLLSLAVVVAAGAAAGPTADGLDASSLTEGGLYGILQSGGLLFFAFAGYARIATMGEEVKDPRRTIPRAIVLALSLAIAVYAVVALTLLIVLGPVATAASSAPLADAAAASGWGWTQPVVRVGAAAASLGALLALIAGIGRTTLAMAREDDLPRFLSAVHPRWRVPHRAELAIGAVVIVAVAFVDLRGAIGFSSFGVLIYYFIANAAAYRQKPEARRYPRALQVLGLIGCTVLVVTLPLVAIAVGTAVVLVGVAYRFGRRRFVRARP